eukprot:757348-Hanusia_phi.AAC.2
MIRGSRVEIGTQLAGNVPHTALVSLVRTYHASVRRRLKAGPARAVGASRQRAHGCRACDTGGVAYEALVFPCLARHARPSRPKRVPGRAYTLCHALGSRKTLTGRVSVDRARLASFVADSELAGPCRAGAALASVAEELSFAQAVGDISACLRDGDGVGGTRLTHTVADEIFVRAHRAWHTLAREPAEGAILRSVADSEGIVGTRRTLGAVDEGVHRTRQALAVTEGDRSAVASKTIRDKDLVILTSLLQLSASML